MTVRGVLLDLDGTVYHHDDPLPGAPETVDRLRERGLSISFFSNNPLHGGQEYVERLQSLGIDARPGEACSSAVVTREYVDAHHAGDDVFVVGSDSIRERIARGRADVVAEPGEADVLLASWTDEFHYDDMTDALRALDTGTVYLGTDPDPTFPGPNGHPVPGSGAILRAITGVTEREPDRVLGKPSDVAIDAALDQLGHEPEDILVVGDRLGTDILLGERAGMQTALVMTGVTDDATLAASDVKPDHVLDSLVEIDTILP
ncbi:HAD-IIA family hydrolase [Haloarcula salinisoli]|uniref:HAD-IIA family hydrolase n=1 Tax=Haloarcula salinisoli TaxID=2487746 RepID=A0A8J7YBG7_9EURY|nr:HAD-IIA family hydrolase [Halomicroarcula salinisoli]MBX0285546.1 HAD-IIA family hydrolase [Halomicroarcula salinisoli]MBX0302970.1 HAD-IIA family hydrolase [Halomicroarcula salinisoli]